MAVSITFHLQIFKCPQLPHFSTNLDKAGIKIHGLLRSFIYKIVTIRDTVPFNYTKQYLGQKKKERIHSRDTALILPFINKNEIDIAFPDQTIVILEMVFTGHDVLIC